MPQRGAELDSKPKAARPSPDHSWRHADRGETLAEQRHALREGTPWYVGKPLGYEVRMNHVPTKKLAEDFR
jgi:hypothetical protein